MKRRILVSALAAVLVVCLLASCARQPKMPQSGEVTASAKAFVDLLAKGDFVGATQEDTVRRSLDHLREYATMLRVLGSYPRFRG